MLRQINKLGKKVILKPIQLMEVEGKISYSESDQSWNLIRLKREILQEYPQLRNKREKFGYTMIITKSEEDFQKAVSEMGDGTIPILLMFNKDS